jgi:AGZA family xanthine/uracil permease-like MFS transporter
VISGFDPTLLRREALAGVTTFLTMSYIAVVNPQILATRETGLPFTAVMTATVLLAAGSSILMGLVARLPYALAPGMGINAFFTHTLVVGDGLTGRQALGAVVLSGGLFLILSLTPARTAVARAFPISLRRAAAVGIGLFLIFLGLRQGGVVVAHPQLLVAPGPPTAQVVTFAAGLFLVTVLLHRKVRGALLAGIAVVTGLAAASGTLTLPPSWVSLPDFSLLFDFELSGLWKPTLIGPILTLLLTDLLDSISTFLGVSQAAGLVDSNGEPLRLERALQVDAFATFASGLLGSSPATTYVESAAGIRAGGRTGATAVVTGLCFLPLLFLSPLAQLVPPLAIAPVLVAVGSFMMGGALNLPDDLLEAVPALLTMTIIPLTLSITQGIIWGVLAYLLLRTAAGRAGEVPGALWAVGALCALVFFAEYI